MPILFDQVNISVSGISFMTKSASINSSTDLSASRSLNGYPIVKNTYNTMVISKFDMEYYLETNNNPNQYLIDSIKSMANPMSQSPVIIKGGGISGSFYLQSYSLDVAPNSLVTANASFISFYPLSGQLIAESATENLLLSSGLAHSWSATLSEDSDPFYSFSYFFDADIKPIYIIGKKEPKQVNIGSASETIKITRNDFVTLDVTGKISDQILTLKTGNLQGLYAYYDLNHPYYIPIALSGFTLTSAQTDFVVDDFVKTSLNFIKNY